MPECAVEGCQEPGVYLVANIVGFVCQNHYGEWQTALVDNGPEEHANSDLTDTNE